MTHKEFLEKGRPACMGQPQEKSEQSIEPERACVSADCSLLSPLMLLAHFVSDARADYLSE